MGDVADELALDHLPSVAFPLSQKRPTTPTLLGIDADSRAMILNHLLVNRVQKQAGAKWTMLAGNESHGEVRDITFTHTGFIFVDPADEWKLIYQKEQVFRTSLSIANVRVLQVCRQLFHEGATILYGKNRFVSQSNHESRPVFPHFAGKLNMASIKTLKMDLPLDVKFDLCNGLQDFLDSLRERLPGLCQLNLTTAFFLPNNRQRRYSKDLTLEEEYRAMLYSAACITHHHQNLNKAIWEAESGQLSARELNNESLSYRIRKHRLSIRLLANDRVVKLQEHKRQYAFPIPESATTEVSSDVGHPPQPSLHPASNATDQLQDFVLDCNAIKNLGVAKLIGARPCDFRL